MERLEFGYSDGYRMALMRVRDEITGGILDDMKRHHRRVTRKELLSWIDCMIEHRAALRDNPFAFVRCNDEAHGGYEIFDSNERKVIQ